jgi:hypothetical protein
MNNQPVPPIKNKVPNTAADHRRQLIWQVWVPLGAAVLIFIALAVWASLATASNSVVGTHFADISAVFLIVPAVIAGFVILVILAAIIFGLAKLLAVLPIFSLRVRAQFYFVEGAVIAFLDKLTQPVLAVDSSWSGLDNFFRHFRKTKS